MSLHKHPRGIRFVRARATNTRALLVANWLAYDSSIAKVSNGWQSWRDNSQFSKQYGRWILLNLRTGETWVEKTV